MGAFKKKSLLIIDDNQLFVDSLKQYLASGNYEIFTAHSVKDGERICLSRKVDVVLLDQKLPDGKGSDLCRTLLSKNDCIKIIFITAFPNLDGAVNALRNGACDYLTKPMELDEVVSSINRAFRSLELETVGQIQNDKENLDSENELIGEDSSLSEIRYIIQLAALNKVPVLISGETGTGKGIVARAIHYSKKNRKSSFVGVNCAALPENLIEAELFGYEKGAFTSAESAKKGVFELADGGTLFLDEIGELPLHLQSKMLGVLDDHRVKRLGGELSKTVSVQVIAATNRNLEEAARQNSFRQDLYYRLSVLPIHMPPLRKRRDDIEALCHHFIKHSAVNPNVTLGENEIEQLKGYPWPGNIRELKNVIERALIFQRAGQIFPSELLSNHVRNLPPEEPAKFPLVTLEEMEKEHITSSLMTLDHNHTQTAKALGISRSTLLRKMKKYNIDFAVS
ncbi:sigma-54-dependent transcriptional regulator [Desulfosediminicola sp.]|uniref:sigma-54-dependent transcriptional regulator n=1 Tax=Desulfosediminicola sp. TaxID=2886825 RepID=UPI003AF1FBB0